LTPLRDLGSYLDSTVTTYRFDGQRGSLDPLQVVPSTPPSYTGNNSGAEIAIAPSGHVVYASNRGHNSIAMFDVDRHTGALAPVVWALTDAKSPRFFGIEPAGKVLYAANADEGLGGRDQQNTDTIVAFKIDETDGVLTPAGQVIKVNSPCTIVFAGA